MIIDFFESGLRGYERGKLKKSDLDYLDNFWISIDALKQDWSAVLSAAFSQESGLASVNSSSPVTKRLGGLIFDETEFDQFKLRAGNTDAQRFAVIEDIGQEDWHSFHDLAFFRFSYPIDISWSEMVHACALAEDMFLRPIRCFFVIVDDGTIGKYVNNDEERPYEIVF